MDCGCHSNSVITLCHRNLGGGARDSLPLNSPFSQPAYPVVLPMPGLAADTACENEILTARVGLG